ncbi:hypothetical protein [Streptomyces cupreus]|uniref:Uncharacterized protein n=1 Tax=Streptomyces cupreus TaxID=2759956 RepID=A0A7X1J8N0_9ACTN|nr:hypothetical protein [Streptomyces cupreus]MBC2906194.1 hypothetical protein [Streptomyces cupreus]
MVVLAPDEYERLAAARRKLGGQAAHLHAMKRELQQARAALDDIEKVLAEAPECHQPGSGQSADGEVDSLRRRLQAVLRTHRPAPHSGTSPKPPPNGPG